MRKVRSNGEEGEIPLETVETGHALSHKRLHFKPTPFEKSLFEETAAPPRRGCAALGSKCLKIESNLGREIFGFQTSNFGFPRCINVKTLYDYSQWHYLKCHALRNTNREI